MAGRRSLYMPIAIRTDDSARPIPRFLAAAALLGVAAGVAFAGAMLATDCHGLRSLLAAEQSPRSMAFLVTLVSAVTFVPVSIAAALGFAPADRPSARPCPHPAAWSRALAAAGRTARHDGERHGHRRR
jgi:hypothetical protein